MGAIICRLRLTGEVPLSINAILHSGSLSPWQSSYLRLSRASSRFLQKLTRRTSDPTTLEYACEGFPIRLQHVLLWVVVPPCHIDA